MTKIKVTHLMKSNPKTCTADDSLSDAAKMMWDHDVGFLPVVDARSKKLVGVITDRDMCMCGWSRGEPLHRLRVSDAMSHKPVSVLHSADLKQATRLMQDHQIRRLPVVDNVDGVVGVLTIQDLLRASLNGDKSELDPVTTFNEITRSRSAVARTARPAAVSSQPAAKMM